MTTLTDFKKAAGLTNAQIGRALGCSTSKAGYILRGAYTRTFSDAEIAKLAEVLGITFERCWMSMCESYNEHAGTPGASHQRYAERVAQVQADMKERLPELAHKIERVMEQPRAWAEVESVLVVPEERRIGE